MANSTSQRLSSFFSLFSKNALVQKFQELTAARPIPARSMRNLLLICFFVSGACGLVYEVAWLRVMGLIFGNTTFATSTVLAGYMAGLGLGALWWGKRIDRSGCPVKTYAKLEAGIGIYAVATPVIWKAIDLLTIGFFRFVAPSFFTALVFKFLVAFSALLFPTFLMGATLPVVSKYFVQSEEDVAKKVGLLYGLNTLGAVFGVLFSGFVALQTFGVGETVYLTAFFNLVIFYLCTRFTAPQNTPALPEKKTASFLAKEGLAPSAFSPAATTTLLAAFAVSGAVSMMYEIAWTRVLAMSLGSSVYAFCVMLATFLFGISLGSYLFSRYSEKFNAGLTSFAVLQLVTALTGLVGINVFNDMPFYFVRVFMASRDSDFVLQIGRFFLCATVMLPPTLAIGAMFACFIHVMKRSRPVGQEVGEAYFANTIGTIAGSVLTGFAIIPLIGIQHTLLLAAGLNTMVGILTFALARPGRDWKRCLPFTLTLLLIAAAAVSVKPWDRGLITSELAVKPERAVGMSKDQLLNSMQERDLLYYKEGLSATVTVVRLRDDLSLAVNGKVDASVKDAFTQVLLGHLPMALHPAPKKVLVIGLGSGYTAAAVAAYPAERIDMVELEKSVVEGAAYFAKFTRGVLSDRRLKIHINDGRNFALLTPEKYDVIISEPSNPWMAGVANLFSLEHYRTMKDRLAPDGIVCQWFHAYNMSPEDLRMIVRTFTEVFPEASLWASYYPDLMLIGKKEPLVLDMKNFERAFEIPEVRQDLAEHGIRSPAGFVASALIFDKELRDLARGARVNSDDHPYLEFSAPKNLYRNTLTENFNLLNGFRRSTPLPEILNLEPPLAKNAAFFNALARGYIAKHFYLDAEMRLIQADAIDPSNPETPLLRGIVFYHTGNREQARIQLRSAIAIRPDLAEAEYYLGLVEEDSKRTPEATGHFRKAVDLDGANTIYLKALANALLKAGQGSQALPFFRKSLGIQPDDFDSQAKKTLLVMDLGTREEKNAAAEEMVRRYPKFAPAYQWLGMLLERDGKIQEAFAIYEKMSEAAPRSATAYLQLSRLSEALGQRDTMKRYARLAIERDPSLAKNPEIQKVLRA